VFLRTEAANASKKLRPPTRPHGATNKKAKNSIFTAVKGSNLTFHHVVSTTSIFSILCMKGPKGGRFSSMELGEREREKSSITRNIR